MLPKGFRFCGEACGVKQDPTTLDLALFTSDQPAVAAGVYTQNRVRSASVDRNVLITPTQKCRAVSINSGNANACTGEKGIVDNQRIADVIAAELDCDPQSCLVMSTGIIGEYLPMDLIESGIRRATARLDASVDAFDAAARAMMTTDQFEKKVHRELSFKNSTATISGAAKGGGMIGPKMATMLAVLLTDLPLTAAQADYCLRRAVNKSFNCISVEGHMSTSDTVILVANGAAGCQELSDEELEQFGCELDSISIELAKMIPSDGEGASHLIRINIHEAQTDQDAERAARTIAHSALVKTAVTGADPNWGRIVSAAGYSNAEFDVKHVSLDINGTTIFRMGQPVPFDAAKLSQEMQDSFEVVFDLRLGAGNSAFTFWTSDLTCDYVQLNSEYHT